MSAVKGSRVSLPMKNVCDRLPKAEEAEQSFDSAYIVEFYSKYV